SDTIVFGSPGYAPPEQYGRGQTEPRSDLYALGATMHHLLTGRDPSIAPFKWPAVRQMNPDVPLVLDKLIMKCVDLEPERRPESAASVGRSLRMTLQWMEETGAPLHFNPPVGNLLEPPGEAVLQPDSPPIPAWETVEIRSEDAGMLPRTGQN